MQGKWLSIGLAVAVVAVLAGGTVWWVASRPAPQGTGVQPTGRTPETVVPTSTVPSSSASRGNAKSFVIPADGQPVPKLSSVPAGAVGVVSADQVSNGTQFVVKFRPVGFGPGAGGLTTLIIHIDSAQGIGGAPGAETLTGMTLATIVTPAVAPSYKTGGTYSAVLLFAPGVAGANAKLSGPLDDAAVTRALGGASQ